MFNFTFFSELRTGINKLKRRRKSNWCVNQNSHTTGCLYIICHRFLFKISIELDFKGLNI